MLKNLFKPRPGARFGLDVYALAVDQARTPAFYTHLGVEDRIDARFELYTLHVLLLNLRFKDEGTDVASDSAQLLFDTYVSALDHALREEGVGDISVGKKMRKLGEALYGRMTAYEAAIRANDTEGLTAALDKNVYGGASTEQAAVLARYALDCRKALAAQDFRTVSKTPAWAQVI